MSARWASSGRPGAATSRCFASAVFGTKGYIFASGLLSTLLLGWYAVQTGITGNLIHTAYNLDYLTMTIIAGVLYLGITFIGIRGLHWIGVVSVPLFVILGGGSRSIPDRLPVGTASSPTLASSPRRRWPSASA